MNSVLSTEILLFMRILSILLLKYHEHGLNNALIGKQATVAGKGCGPEAKGQQRLRWLDDITGSVEHD